jgi:hypothetical protein
MTVNLADSLCMIPVSDSVINMPTWPKSASGGLTYGDDTPFEHACDNGSFIGINLKKSLPVDPDTHVVYPVNKSGLKIDTIPDGLEHSGGLSVNAGDFLVIGKPGDDTATITQNDYYDYGKLHVNVNTNYGLGDVGDGALGITIYNQGGLTFNNGSLMVNPGKFISIHETNNTVDVNVDPMYGLGDVNSNNTLCIKTDPKTDCLHFKDSGEIAVKWSMGVTHSSYNYNGKDVNNDLYLLTSDTAPSNWGQNFQNDFWKLDAHDKLVQIDFTVEGGVVSPAYEPNKYYQMLSKDLEFLTAPTEDYPSDWGEQNKFYGTEIHGLVKVFKLVVFENRGYIYPPYEPNKYYRLKSPYMRHDFGFLGVNIVDSLSGTRSINGSDSMPDIDLIRGCYGGLRYIQNMVGSYGVGIGIRINEDRAWDDTGRPFEGEDQWASRKGSRGLEITDMNVLGIQLSENSKLEFDGNGCLQANTNTARIYGMCAYKTTIVGRDASGLPLDRSGQGGAITVKGLTDVLAEINYLRDNNIDWSAYDLLPGDTLIFTSGAYLSGAKYEYIISRTSGSNTFYTEDPARFPAQTCCVSFIVESVNYSNTGYLNNVSLYCTFSTLQEITVGTRLS